MSPIDNLRLTHLPLLSVLLTQTFFLLKGNKIHVIGLSISVRMSFFVGILQ